MQELLKYDEYINLGGQADDAAFPLLSFKAVKVLEKVTNKRIYKIDEVPIEVKMALTEIINIYNQSVTNSGNVASYSNGIESISYIKNSDIQADNDEQIKRAIRDILPTELLYRGRRQWRNDITNNNTE